jgi:hypothetical protein
MSGVFQIIDPSPPGECVPPALGVGEDTLAGWRGGWRVNILEDARHSAVLYTCKYFVLHYTAYSIEISLLVKFCVSIDKFLHCFLIFDVELIIIVPQKENKIYFYSRYGVIGGEGRRPQIEKNTCRKVPLQVKFFGDRHFAICMCRGT